MTRCSITCAEPGCSCKIYYDTEEDIEVPLYCCTHRTEEGRHSQVREIVEGKIGRIV